MGDKNRITHKHPDTAFEKLMRDMDTGKIRRKQNWFMDHPAYYGTSLQQKSRSANICAGCVYFEAQAAGLKRACKFPWKAPKDYDRINIKFLPCKGKTGL